jgi:hypothetical protein
MAEAGGVARLLMHGDAMDGPWFRRLYGSWNQANDCDRSEKEAEKSVDHGFVHRLAVSVR